MKLQGMFTGKSWAQFFFLQSGFFWKQICYILIRVAETIGVGLNDILSYGQNTR